MDLSAFLTYQDTILLDGAMGTQLALRGLNMGGQTGTEGRQKEKEGRYLEHVPPAKAVPGPASTDGPQHATKKCRAYRPARHNIVEIEMGGEKWQCAVDYRRVKTI